MAAARSLDTRTSLEIGQRQPDSQTIASYSITGHCFAYVDENNKPTDGNDEKSAAPCKEYCSTRGDGTNGCSLFIPKGQKIDPHFIYKDDDGKRWTPAKCVCECPFCKELAETIAEGLQKLDNIICAAMVSAFTTIVETGIQFVPGGQTSLALRAAISGAKSFTENGLNAASFFGDWVGKACGVDNWNFDLTSVYDPLVNAPDSMGTSTGCKKRNKADCKKLDPKPDPTTKAKDTPPKTTQNPQKSSQQSTTSTESSSSTKRSQTTVMTSSTTSSSSTASETKEANTDTKPSQTTEACNNTDPSQTTDGSNDEEPTQTAGSSNDVESSQTTLITSGTISSSMLSGETARATE
ncbi:hypothetical protein JX266_006123 [Neoarthrinium moseri]|nr:hypothetical protein JX266_006123 [Neoarthrinium moseri]